jgi:hypothetical protein
VDRTIDLLRGARRLDGNGRDLHRHGTVTAQHRHDRGRVLLRARDQHTPAEQGLDFEPVELVALRDNLADDDDTRTGLLRRLHDRRDIAQRADDRALINGGAATSDRDWGARIGLGTEQLGRDLDDLVSALEEHMSDARVDEFRPHEFGVIGIDDANLASATTGESEAGVGGDTGDVADTRGNLEGDLGLTQSAGLVQQRAVDNGIARDEADSALAFLGSIDDELCALDVLERKTAGTHGDNDLGIR